MNLILTQPFYVFFLLSIIFIYYLCTMRIAIIGAGAAGCFAAVNLKKICPQAHVTVYESGRKPLAKVAVTGGGRCNLTNSFAEVRGLAAVYPRGERLMKRLLRVFGHEDVCAWFEREGVRLVTQDDCCVFPQSQDAMEIVGTLTRLMHRGGVRLLTGCRVVDIVPLGGAALESGAAGGERFSVVARPADALSPDDVRSETYDVVIVTTGGSQKLSGLDMLRQLSVDTVSPVPSLFSLCLPGCGITEMSGTVVADVTAGLTGTKLRASGPLLITHWGMSGPAILKLSSYAARLLHDNDYRAELCINWFGDATGQEAQEALAAFAVGHPQRQLSSLYPRQLNNRLWQYLLAGCGLNPAMRWGELGRKGMNRLVETLVNSRYRVDGKNRFKEEFVTCGGVSLGEVDPRTLECRKHSGLYFAGEVLDVDAITGGFNLQAAWTMGYVVARAVGDKYQKSFSQSIKPDNYDK